MPDSNGKRSRKARKAERAPTAPAPRRDEPREIARREECAREFAALKALTTPEEFARRGPVFELPPRKRTIDLGGGKNIPWPRELAMDPDLSRLRDFASGLLLRARATPSPWLVAFAHILTATANALRVGDSEALEELHTAARKQLRSHADYVLTNEQGEPTVVASTQYLPVESGGRLTDSFAGGFARLSALVARVTAVCRSSGHSLEVGSEPIATCLLYNFAGLSGLDPGGDEVAHEFVHGRVAAQLVAHGKKIAMTSADPSGHDLAGEADEIAEALIRTELAISGKTKAEIKKALGFLKQRHHRQKDQ